MDPAPTRTSTTCASSQAAYQAWRAQEPDPDDDPCGRGFGDRRLHLETTLDGAGRISGDLTPECAVAVTAVIEALGKPGARRTSAPPGSGTTTPSRKPARC